MSETEAAGDLPVSFSEVQAAAVLLAGVAVRTPISRAQDFDRAGGQIWLKREELQHTGSFKFRGAYLAAQQSLCASLCTVSSGNHGRALARSGRLLGRRVRVHMPHDAPDLKVAGVRAEGAEVVFFNRYERSQASVTAELLRDPDYEYVSAHDHPAVIAGAGTVGLELLTDLSELDVIVVPIGGGGAAAGIGLVARRLRPSLMVIGVEPSAGGVARASLEAGRRLEFPVPRTIADGQTLTTPGRLTFAIMRDVVDDVILVTDDDISAAMEALDRSCGVRAEPSGACTAAAVLTGQIDHVIDGRRVGVIVSGGNVGR